MVLKKDLIRCTWLWTFDKNIYDLSDEDKKEIRSVPGSLEEALDALESDTAFLTESGVFSDDFIANYIALKRNEAKQVAIRIHPHEFNLYFNA